MQKGKDFKLIFHQAITGAYSSAGEQWTEDPCVPGSNPGKPILKSIKQKLFKSEIFSIKQDKRGNLLEKGLSKTQNET